MLLFLGVIAARYVLYFWKYVIHVELGGVVDLLIVMSMAKSLRGNIFFALVYNKLEMFVSDYQVVIAVRSTFEVLKFKVTNIFLIR